MDTAQRRHREAPAAARARAPRLRAAKAAPAAAAAGTRSARRGRRRLARRVALGLCSLARSFLLDGPLVGPSSTPVGRPAAAGRRLPSRTPGLADWLAEQLVPPTQGRGAPARPGRDRRNDDKRRSR